MKESLLVFKKYPFRCIILMFVMVMQVRSYFTYKFIWPFSHKTVMYSKPTDFPTDRLFLLDEETKKPIDTNLIVPRPSKLTFLYKHYDKKDKSYQTYLEKLAFNKEFLKSKKVLLMKETIEGFGPLCGDEEREVVRAACLNKGVACD